MSTDEQKLRLGIAVNSDNASPDDDGIVWVYGVTNPDLKRQGLRDDDVLVTLFDRPLTKLNYLNVRRILFQKL